MSYNNDAAATPLAGTGRPHSGDNAIVNHAGVDIPIESDLTIEVNVDDDSVVVAAIAAAAASAGEIGVELARHNAAVGIEPLSQTNDFPKDNGSRNGEDIDTQAGNVTPEPSDIGPGRSLPEASLYSGLSTGDLNLVLPVVYAAKSRRPDWFLASLLEDTMPSTIPDGHAAKDSRCELMGAGFWDITGIDRANSRVNAGDFPDQVAMIRLFEQIEKIEVHAIQK